MVGMWFTANNRWHHSVILLVKDAKYIFLFAEKNINGTRAVSMYTQHTVHMHTLNSTWYCFI